MPAETKAEHYPVYPSYIGNAKKVPFKWDSALDWLRDKHPDEYAFCLTYKVDNDQVQDKHQSEMDEDGFFDRKSESDCDCCGKNIIPGTRMFRMEHADGTTQEPLCFTCAGESLEEEAVFIHNEAVILESAKMVADQLVDVGYWNVLAWVIAQDIPNDILLHALERHFNDGKLRQWITKNLFIGAATW
jgi:hypothetical protein